MTRWPTRPACLLRPLCQLQRPPLPHRPCQTGQRPSLPPQPQPQQYRPPRQHAPPKPPSACPNPNAPVPWDSVVSSVGPSFSGWGPNSRIRLANGQVWLVVDGTSVALPEGSRKVSVKRGALSSYYLDFEGLNTSPRVRRVE